VRKVAYEVAKFAIYLAIASSTLLSRIPLEASRSPEQWLILIAALLAICIAVNSTMDWVRDTVRDMIARRRSKRDSQD